MPLKDQSSRETFSKKFVREGEILKAALSKLVTYAPQAISSVTRNSPFLKILYTLQFYFQDSPFDSLPLLAEFLKLKDLSMLFLEVSVRVLKCYV